MASEVIFVLVALVVDSGCYQPSNFLKALPFDSLMTKKALAKLIGVGALKGGRKLEKKKEFTCFYHFRPTLF